VKVARLDETGQRRDLSQEQAAELAGQDFVRELLHAVDDVYRAGLSEGWPPIATWRMSTMTSSYVFSSAARLGPIFGSWTCAGRFFVQSFCADYSEITSVRRQILSNRGDRLLPTARGTDLLRTRERRRRRLGRWTSS